MVKSIDSVWEETHKNQSWGKYPSEHVIRFIARNYYSQERRKIRILDFGCGGGAHTWFLCREGFDVYAFDGAPSAIKKTEQYLQEEELYADLRVRDAICLDYDTEFFNCIIDNVTIDANNLADIETMYSECFKLLINNGKLLTVVFGKETTGFGTGKKLEEDTYQEIENEHLKSRGKIHFFDKKSIYNILSKTGFVDIQIDTIDYTDQGVKMQQLVCVAKKL